MVIRFGIVVEFFLMYWAIHLHIAHDTQLVTFFICSKQWYWSLFALGMRLHDICGKSEDFLGFMLLCSMFEDGCTVLLNWVIDIQLDVWHRKLELLPIQSTSTKACLDMFEAAPYLFVWVMDSCFLLCYMFGGGCAVSLD